MYSAGNSYGAAPMYTNSSALKNLEDIARIKDHNTPQAKELSEVVRYESPLAKIAESAAIKIPEHVLILMPEPKTPVERSIDGPGAYMPVPVIYLLSRSYSEDPLNTRNIYKKKQHIPHVRSIEGSLSLDEKEQAQRDENKSKKYHTLDGKLEEKEAANTLQREEHNLNKTELMQKSSPHKTNYKSLEESEKLEKTIEEFLGLKEYEPLKMDRNTLSGVGSYNPLRSQDRSTIRLYRTSIPEDSLDSLLKYNPNRQQDKKDQPGITLYAVKSGYAQANELPYMQSVSYSGKGNQLQRTSTGYSQRQSYAVPVVTAYLAPINKEDYKMPKDKLAESITRYGHLGYKLAA